MVSQAKDPMLLIWEQTAQVLPDGQKHIVWRDQYDLDYLYMTGFVDTDQFTREQWIEAFQDSLRPDGSYRVTLDQWLAKSHFRFNGLTGKPFDPMQLPERELDLDEFEKLLKEKILPSTTIPESQFRKAVEKTKDTSFRGGKFHLDRPFKINLSQLLLIYPSPRHNRELAVAKARLNLQKDMSVKAKTSATAARPVSPGSHYSSGPTQEKRMTDQLSRLLGKGRKNTL